MPLTELTKALLESLDSDPAIAAEDGAISFIIDDNVEIDILAALEPDAFVIRSVVGDVSPGAGAELYATPLAANHNGLETKGAALALDTTVPTTEITVATLTDEQHLDAILYKLVFVGGLLRRGVLERSAVAWMSFVVSAVMGNEEIQAYLKWLQSDDQVPGHSEFVDAVFSTKPSMKRLEFRAAC